MPHLRIPGGKELHPVELHGVLDLHLLHVVENTDIGKYKSSQGGRANIIGNRTRDRG
jgi:hypothetical protein